MNMNYEDDYEDDFYEESGLSEEELIEIMEAYRRRKLVEHLIGPVVSTVVHIIMIILFAIFLAFPAVEDAPEVTVEMKEVEIKEIEEKILEQLEEIEEVEVTDDMPQLEAPDVPTENTDNSIENVNDDMPSTDDNMDMSEVLDIKVTNTALKMPGLYGGRSKAGRSGKVSRYGGKKRGQESLLRALHWLRDHQNPDGSWGQSNKAAMSGLALLTFLAHGETPSSKDFGNCVRKAMEWLVSKANTGKMMERAYSHGIATYAISEGYAMTGIPMLKEAMDKAIKVIIEGQYPTGGFAYRYNKDKIRKDLSVGGWQYQALKAAYTGGCEVENLYRAIKKGIKYVKECAHETSFAYSMDGIKKASGGSHCMRAVGVLCLQLLGEGLLLPKKRALK